VLEHAATDAIIIAASTVDRAARTERLSRPVPLFANLIVRSCGPWNERGAGRRPTPLRHIGL
jgi:hypothetical protein